MTTTAQSRTTDPVVRPLTQLDEVELRQVFRDTFVMGQPLPFSLDDGGRYEALCLDWYLGAGRNDAAVVDADGEIVGFALVCTNQAAFQRWVRARAVRYTIYSVLTLMSTNPHSPVARFYRSRLRDGWVMMRSPTAPFPAHAHVNVRPHRLAGWAGGLLLSYVDERCRVAGISGWYGEINAPVGKRTNALARVVGPVVHRAPNHTLSWLMDRPVERLTVARQLPSAQGEQT